MLGRKIRLKLRSFDFENLNHAIADISLAVNKLGGYIKVIHLPNKIFKFTLNRSPHIYKKSREQFEIRHHTRVIIIDSCPRVVGSLMKLDIEAGVDVHVMVKS